MTEYSVHCTFVSAAFLQVTSLLLALFIMQCIYMKEMMLIFIFCHQEAVILLLILSSDADVPIRYYTILIILEQ